VSPYFISLYNIKIYMYSNVIFGDTGDK
jgi:hypothetical protein